MQQKDRKPHYLIKIRGLWDLKVPSSMLNLAKIGNIGVKKPPEGGFKQLAEEAGFEPAVGYKPTHAFQACDLNRSSTLPNNPQLYVSRKSCHPILIEAA